MAGVWNDSGVQDALDAIRQATEFANAKMRLFTNDVTPDDTTTLAGLTEASFAGYAPVSIGSAWGTVSLAGHVASSTGPACTFIIASGGATIYGWYITDAANTKLLASKRADAGGIALSTTGVSTFTVVPTIQAKDVAT